MGWNQNEDFRGSNEKEQNLEEKRKNRYEKYSKHVMEECLRHINQMVQTGKISESEKKTFELLYPNNGNLRLITIDDLSIAKAENVGDFYEKANKCRDFLYEEETFDPSMLRVLQYPLANWRQRIEYVSIDQEEKDSKIVEQRVENIRRWFLKLLAKTDNDNITIEDKAIFLVNYSLLSEDIIKKPHEETYKSFGITSEKVKKELDFKLSDIEMRLWKTDDLVKNYLHVLNFPKEKYAEKITYRAAIGIEDEE